MYWALVEEHGFNPNFYQDYTTGGNNLALRLVMEGIFLQPCSPGFVDGRDAILLADQNLTGGQNQCLIWEAFAKRGLGAFADQGSSNSNSDGTASFDTPATCQLLNAASTNIVCTPTDGNFAVALGTGFVPPVTLSTENLPVGVSAHFGMNPVISVPNATRLTVTGTENLPDGTYSFNITATAGIVSATQTVSLVVYHDSPASPELSAPANAASEVSRKPLLVWTEGVPGCTSMEDLNQKLPNFGENENVLDLVGCLNQVLTTTPNRGASPSAEYTVEVDDDPGFGSIDFTTTTMATEYQVSSSLLSLTTYYWRVKGANECGDSSYSPVWSFQTLDVAPILLVDDDDNDPNVSSYFENALVSLGLSYDVWDTNNTDNEPSAAELMAYQKVIWFTGDEWGGAAGPGSLGEAALATYLDNGGCFLLSSQDYFYDRTLTSFMSDYLGVVSAANDQAQLSLTGEAGAIFDGLGPYTLSFPIPNFSDILTPGNSGVSTLMGSLGVGAVQKVTGNYTTVYSAVPLCALPTQQAMEEVLSAFLNACN